MTRAPLLENELSELTDDIIREPAFLAPEANQSMGCFSRGTSPQMIRQLSPIGPHSPRGTFVPPNHHQANDGFTELCDGVSMRLQRRGSPTQAQIAGSLEELRRMQEAGHFGRKVQVQGVLRDFGVAMFTVFMSVTDAVAMGAVLFPTGWQLQSMGMRIGLISMATTSIFIAMTSQVAHSVGGLCDTIIPTMRDFFQTLEKMEASAKMIPTALMGIPLISVATGVATLAAGYCGIGSVVEACPEVVFNGFIAGTGAQLLEFGINMMLDLPEFSFLSQDSWEQLCCKRGMALCGPGVAAAVFVFLLPRYYSKVDTFLLPVVVVILFLCFYAGIFLCETSLDDARDDGWLFNVTDPSVAFYKVWTEQDVTAVSWPHIFSASFLQTTLQVFAVSFLTCVKNIYGTREVTKTEVDINKEICSTGLITLACGMAFSLPGGMVMSFSVTAHQLGASSKRFSWFQALLSVALLISGDFVVSVLPKMVPACVVLWIGLVLLIFYAWDPIGTLPLGEYSIILAMIFSDLLLGCGPMILIGLSLVGLSKAVSHIRQAWMSNGSLSGALMSQLTSENGYGKAKYVI